MFFRQAIMFLSLFTYIKWYLLDSLFTLIQMVVDIEPIYYRDCSIWTGIMIPIRITLTVTDLALDGWGDWTNRDIYGLSRYRKRAEIGDLPVFQWCPTWGHNQNPYAQKRLLGFWTHEAYLESDWLTWAEYYYLTDFQQKIVDNHQDLINWATIDYAHHQTSRLKFQILHNIVNWPTQ